MLPEGSSYPSAMDPGFYLQHVYRHIADFVRSVVASEQSAFVIGLGEVRRTAVQLPLGEWLDALPWWLRACEGEIPDDPAVACFVEACQEAGLMFREGRRMQRVSLNMSSLRHAKQSNALVAAIRQVAAQKGGAV